MRKLTYIREHVVEKELVKLCKEYGWLCWKFVSPGLRGVPDRILLNDGTAIFVELKAPGEKPTPQQLRRHEELKAQGFIVVTLDSVEAVRRWLGA